MVEAPLANPETRHGGPRIFSSAGLFRIAVFGWALSASAFPLLAQVRVVVCLSYRYLDPDSQIQIDQAVVTASEVFKKAGVRVDWRRSEGSCVATESKPVLVTFSANEKALTKKDALAYAMPFEGSHIVVLYHLVQGAVIGHFCSVPELMGYVLAHEITHLLQECDCHAKEGVMKERWNRDDYRKMRYSLLQFTAVDIDLIKAGPWGSGSSK